MEHEATQSRVRDGLRLLASLGAVVFPVGQAGSGGGVHVGGDFRLLRSTAAFFRCKAKVGLRLSPAQDLRHPQARGLKRKRPNPPPKKLSERQALESRWDLSCLSCLAVLEVPGHDKHGESVA